MARVLVYTSRDTGFDSRRYQIFREDLGLERGPFILVRSVEELLEIESGYFDLENRLTAEGIRCVDHATPSTSKSRHCFAGRGGRSVHRVRYRTRSHVVCLF
jgi:hypothetical protein